jgi:hypothetical protein
MKSPRLTTAEESRKDVVRVMSPSLFLRLVLLESLLAMSVVDPPRLIRSARSAGETCSRELVPDAQP